MLDKESLLKPRLIDEVMELLTGGEIRVRGLSRDEVLQLRLGPDATFEARLLVFGVVEPELTEAEAIEWQKASPAKEIELVQHKISDLSGMGAAFPVEAYKSVRSESDA